MASRCTGGRAAGVAILVVGGALAIAPDACAWGRRMIGGGFGGMSYGYGGGGGFNQGSYGAGNGAGFPSSGGGLIESVNRNLFGLPGAIAFAPPAIPGIGQASGWAKACALLGQARPHAYVDEHQRACGC